MLILTLAAAPAWAGHWTLAGGPAVASGSYSGGSYTAISSFVALNSGAHIWLCEAGRGVEAGRRGGGRGGSVSGRAKVRSGGEFRFGRWFESRDFSFSDDISMNRTFGPGAKVRS